MSSPMHGKAAMCRMGKTVRAGVPRCPRFSLANRESGTIGNLDALSFLNGATVGYDESRVPAGTSGGRESAGRGTVGKVHVKGPEVFLRAFYMHQAVGRLDVEFQTVALWLFLKQPTIAHIRANAARPFASCLLSTPAGFPRHRHRRWQPHPEKGVGLYLPSQRIAPGRRKPFFYRDSL